MTVRRPRIVVLATLARLGGAERSLVELVRRCAEELACTVLVPEDGPLVAATVAAGADCRIVEWPRSLLRLGERGGRLSGLAPAGAALVPFLARFVRELRAFEPDVLVTNGIKAHVLGALVRRRLDTPLVWYAREGLEDRPHSRTALRLLGRRCDGVVAISRYVASEMRPLVPGPAAVHLVPNIVDPARVQPGLALPSDLTKPAGEVWLGVVGALTPLKGQDLFLEAAARVAAKVPSARFLLVGGEPYRTGAGRGFGDMLRAHVEAVGLVDHVRFLGERDDATAIISNLDVLVQPNRGPEGLGRALLEAMACGVPAIAPDRWGPRELVRDGKTGFLVPPGDIDALTAAMTRLSRDLGLRRSLGWAARRTFVSRDDAGQAPQAFRRAIDDVLGRRPLVRRTIEAPIVRLRAGNE